MNPVEVFRGDGPVVLGFPHVGTCVPASVFDRLSNTGQKLTDTDWHIDQLYDGLLPGASTVKRTAPCVASLLTVVAGTPRSVGLGPPGMPGTTA